MIRAIVINTIATIIMACIVLLIGFGTGVENSKIRLRTVHEFDFPLVFCHRSNLHHFAVAYASCIAADVRNL